MYMYMFTCALYVLRYTVHVCISNWLWLPQLTREKKNYEEKLKDIHTALEQEENKAKQEHRQRVKLEQLIAELEEKLEREIKVLFQIFSSKFSPSSKSLLTYLYACTFCILCISAFILHALYVYHKLLM